MGYYDEFPEKEMPENVEDMYCEYDDCREKYDKIKDTIKNRIKDLQVWLDESSFHDVKWKEYDEIIADFMVIDELEEIEEKRSELYRNMDDEGWCPND